MAEDYAARSERVKALLSSYYGDSAAPSASGTAQLSAPAAAQSAASVTKQGAPGQHGFAAIDTPVFNAQQHTQDILRLFPLEKLMVEHRNMAREIKNLDSDMQQLVYENYNKFIAATDTIRGMQSSVDGMQGELKRLQDTAGEPKHRSSLSWWLIGLLQILTARLPCSGRGGPLAVSELQAAAAPGVHGGAVQGAAAAQEAPGTAGPLATRRSRGVILG
jgi:hypothetical protein